MRIGKRTKSIIGVGAIILSVVLGILWNTVLRDELTSADVYVLRQDIGPGNKVLPDNLAVRRIARPDVLKGAICKPEDARSLTKLEAKQFIPAGAQLLPQYFDQPELILGKGQFIFSIPADWIIALPDTIRRKDTAYFYAYSTVEAQRLIKSVSGSEQERIEATQTPYPTIEVDAPLDAPISSDVPIVPAPSPCSIDEVANLSASLLASLVESKKYQFSAIVAYCKDRSNQEVMNVGASSGDGLERFAGSAVIAHIEIVATEDQIDTMQRAVMQGYKFIVLYR